MYIFAEYGSSPKRIKYHLKNTAPFFQVTRRNRGFRRREPSITRLIPRESSKGPLQREISFIAQQVVQGWFRGGSISSPRTQRFMHGVADYRGLGIIFRKWGSSVTEQSHLFPPFPFAPSPLRRSQQCFHPPVSACQLL